MCLEDGQTFEAASRMTMIMRLRMRTSQSYFWMLAVAAAIVSRPFGSPTATFEPTKTPAFSPVGNDQEMSPRVRRGLPPSPPRRPVLPLPRPRRRTMSFVDTRTILAADDPSFDPDHETQHEFVKRRHAARAAVLRKRAEERNRETMAVKRAAAEEAARLKLYASSNPPKETSPRGSPITANTGNLRTSPISGLVPMASHFQTSPTSRGRASKEAPIQTAAKSNVDAERANPRKRSRGFGLDEDDLAVHEEDFTPEEWEVLKAQVEKAEEDAAKAAQESVPPTKKRRVDQSPKQQKRTQRSVRRQTTTPRHNQPPSRTTGFVPNRRGTFAPPDLSPIDSSRSLNDPDSPSVSQTSPAATQSLETNEVPRSTPKNGSKSRRESRAQASQKGTMINGVYFPKHPVPCCDSSAEEAYRFPHRAFLPKMAATYWLRRERRWNPGRLFTLPKLFQPQEAEEVPKPPQTPNAPKKRVRWADLESPYSSGINQDWYNERFESAPTTPVSILRRVREPSQTSRTFEDTSLAASSPTLPTMPRPAIKRKRDAASASDMSSSFLRPVKRSRGYQAPDPYGSSSSPSSASPQSPPSNAARYFSSLQPRRHLSQYVETSADITYPNAAATEDFAVENDDPSPLSRARNKAELFKPKTPSRLRESTRIPSSNTSTPSALGYSSPSFLGALLDNSPYRSDPMSIDGSSYLQNPDTPPVGSIPSGFRREDLTPLPPLRPGASPTAPIPANTPPRTLVDDVAWLLQASPDGNFAALPWPARGSLVEVLDTDSEAVPIVEKYWQVEGADPVEYFEAQFEKFESLGLRFV
ncbi:uncharacterized protein N7473_007179 [Penicillium subrubescens]|uniref:uncharacterized protein n=1 Tax=Penicillium subrubescens TaxID=1316194 RepID=UPI00254508A1|nr:uncharacterized protein N7473_007179 [Penicillium subrubescens]KAJ5890951.1 hypothetical protein N7473_007179 [Penicillium subrubescens]